MMKKLIIGTVLLIVGTVISQTTQQKLAAARNKALTTETPTPAKVEALNAGTGSPNYVQVRQESVRYGRYYGSTLVKAASRKGRG